MISAILGIGGGLGIILAGPIIDTFDYHWLFWFPLIAVVAATVATIFFVPESPVRSPGRVDWRGAALLTGWVVLMLLGISQTAEWGWGDPRVIALILAAFALLFLWVRVEERQRGAARRHGDDARPRGLDGRTPLPSSSAPACTARSSSSRSSPRPPPSAGYGFGASVTEAGLFLLPCTLAMLHRQPARRLARRVGSDRG